MTPQIKLTDYADPDNPVNVPFETLSQALLLLDESRTMLLTIEDNDSTGMITLENWNSLQVSSYNY
jgi:hypothetical protein